MIRKIIFLTYAHHLWHILCVFVVSLYNLSAREIVYDFNLQGCLRNDISDGLVGCASMNKAECLNADRHMIGIEDGSQI